MLDLKIKVVFDPSINQNTVNCIGFFNSDFFSLIDLTVKQEEIYTFYKKVYEADRRVELSRMYEALEHMRVALLKG